MKAQFSELQGKTIIDFKNTDRRIDILCSDGWRYTLYHEDDDCAEVTVEDICGDINDILNLPICMAEEVSNNTNEFPKKPCRAKESTYTWTFYKLGTAKGIITMRWYGTSNGYYSERVDCIKEDMRWDIEADNTSLKKICQEYLLVRRDIFNEVKLALVKAEDSLCDINHGGAGDGLKMVSDALLAISKF